MVWPKEPLTTDESNGDLFRDSHSQKKAQATSVYRRILAHRRI